MQRFIARYPTEFSNGAIGYAPGGPFDCLGPYAKVKNCPVEGIARRYTCYASGYADTYFSTPASTSIKGRIIKGYFTVGDETGSLIFRPLEGELDKINKKEIKQ